MLSMIYLANVLVLRQNGKVSAKFMIDRYDFELKMKDFCSCKINIPLISCPKM